MYIVPHLQYMYTRKICGFNEKYFKRCVNTIMYTILVIDKTGSIKQSRVTSIEDNEMYK